MSDPRQTAPRVSVVTATYNYSSVLRYAIQSALMQTFTDFEVLVIGDGCTDDSAEVVAGFGDPRLRWRNLPENSGHQSTPNNAGIEMARGEYIAYLGHDDVWHPAHLELLVSAMDERGADLGYTLTEMIAPDELGYRTVRGIGPYRPGQLVMVSSIMHRRDVVSVVGGWRDYRTLTTHPAAEFPRRVWEYRQRGVSVPRLTVFKFPAPWRPNTYRDKPSEQQAAYVHRIQTEPDFLERELLAIVTAYALGKGIEPPHMRPDQPPGAPPGWRVEYMRRLRGLEPRPLPKSTQPVSLRKRLHFWLRGPRYRMKKILSDLIRLLD